MYLLGAWADGKAPSAREVRRVTGFGNGRTRTLIEEAWTWAGENGADRPPPIVARAALADIDNEDGNLFELPGPLTHADVVARAVRWLRGHHACRAVYAEISTYERVNPDAIGFRKPAGGSCAWSVLIEAKVSRSDFRADREKIIHRCPDLCPGQERWYLTPPNLLRAAEIPAGWGLAEVGARSVRIVLPAPIAPSSPGRAHADMGILLSVVRRHEVGARWFDGLAKFEPYYAATGAK